MLDGFDIQVIARNGWFLANGMLVSLELTVVAALGGVLLGTLLAMMRLAKSVPVSASAACYVNCLRSLPLILVIFWFYMLVPKLLGRPTGAFYSVLVAFVLFEAAYYCEIVRAGISGIRRGQVRAGLALGLSRASVMRYVVLPQAFRNMVPVLLTQVIVLFQDTSLVYVVGVRDFLTSADVVANINNRPIELYTTVAVVFLILCSTGSFVVHRLQRRHLP